jgi:hypothetical protein
MGLDISKVLGVAQVVAGVVRAVQSAHADKAGADKHEIARTAILGLLPGLEGLTGAELDNPEVVEAVNACIVAEKAVLKARAAVADAVAVVRAARG